MATRVVLDTNVVVSALLWKGTPGQIIPLIEQGFVVMIMTPAIVAEYRAVIQRETFRLIIARRGTSWSKLLIDLLQYALVVPDRLSPVRIEADPSDEKFLAAAMTGDADALVSGDRHLLDLKDTVALPILTPSQFVQRFLGRS